MEFKKYFTKKFLKEVALLVYERVVYNMLKEVVARTDTKWDDQALAAADGIIRDALAIAADETPAA